MRRAAVLAGVFTLVVCSVHGQAWLPAKDTRTFGLGYQSMFISRHLLARGQAVDAGHIQAHSYSMLVGYSPSDRVALSASLPYVESKYYGRSPHQLPIDDGTFHGTWQDYRIEARFQAKRDAFAITPFIAAIIPSHNYTYFAHSAAGRDLHETALGVYTGVVDPLAHFRGCGCPTNTYVQARLAYSLVEHVLGRRIDHADLDVDAGYFVTDKIAVRALGSYLRTIGGVDFSTTWWSNYNSPIFLHHDQLLAARHLNAGVGANYAFSDVFDAYASVLHMIGGRNGHKIDLAANVGVAWSFAPRGIRTASLHVNSGGSCPLHAKKEK